MHALIMIVVGIVMALVGSDYVATKIDYRKLRESTGKALLMMIVFIVAFSLAVSAPGLFGILGAGVAALLFGVCWNGCNRKT